MRRLFQILQMPIPTLASSGKLNIVTNLKGLSQIIKREKRKWWCQRSKVNTERKVGDAKGFQSILKKSLHFDSSRFRDEMLKLTSLNSSENTMGLFVDDLDDIKILFHQMSPQVKILLDDCFVKTVRCASIMNADWETGTPFMVFNLSSSLIDHETANYAITDGNEVFGSDVDRQNK